VASPELRAHATTALLDNRDVVIFRLLEPPSLKDFAAIVGRARKVSKQTGMTQADITNAVKKVRRLR